ncbi:MAG: response regulator, partial [Anaerolineales bacterium]|nr:response regulator [Anaerolineales bacterium]
MTKPLALVVDDDIDVAGFFTFALQDADYETKVVHDGQKALTALQELTPHLMILDMYLPDTTGKDILQHVCGDGRFSDSWVIVATGVGKSLEGWVGQEAGGRWGGGGGGGG